MQNCTKPIYDNSSTNMSKLPFTIKARANHNFILTYVQNTTWIDGIWITRFQPGARGPVAGCTLSAQIPGMGPVLSGGMNLEVGDAFGVLLNASPDTAKGGVGQVKFYGWDENFSLKQTYNETWTGSQYGPQDYKAPIRITDSTVQFGNNGYQVGGDYASQIKRSSIPKTTSPNDSPAYGVGPEYWIRAGNTSPSSAQYLTYQADKNAWISAEALKDLPAVIGLGRRFFYLDKSGYAGVDTYSRDTANYDSFVTITPSQGAGRRAWVSGGDSTFVGLENAGDQNSYYRGVFQSMSQNGAYTYWSGMGAYWQVTQSPASDDEDVRGGKKLVGRDIAIAFHTQDNNPGPAADATNLRLMHASSGPNQPGFVGGQTTKVVDNVQYTTGYESQQTAGLSAKTTRFTFDAQLATIDKAGRYARFNHTTVHEGAGTDGSTDPNDQHYGYTDYYFFNGLNPATGNNGGPLPNYTTSDGENSSYAYGLMDGAAYYIEHWSEKFSGGHWVKDTLIVKNQNYFFGQSIDLSQPVPNAPISYSSYVVPVKQVGFQDQVSSTTTQQYFSQADVAKLTGFLKSSTLQRFNANGQQETLKNDYLYGVQAYGSGWLSPQMLSPIAKVTQTNLTAGSTIGINATTYKGWGASFNTMEPLSTYTWVPGAVQDFDFYGPNSTWVQGAVIEHRTSAGQVDEASFRQSTQAPVVYSGVKYDRNNRFAIATFSNAQTQGANATASYWGAESYENDTEWEKTPMAAFTTADAHTGSRSLVSTSATNASNEFAVKKGLNPNGSGSVGTFEFYVFSTWVTVPNSKKVTLTVTSYNNKKEKTYEFTRDYVGTSAEQDSWQYLELYLYGDNADTVEAKVTSNDVGIMVDDLRFSPTDSQFTATVYDATRELAIATLGNNGETNRTIYDQFDMPYASIGAAENVKGVATHYYSRSGNGDAFNPADPNSVIGLVGMGDGVYTQFNKAGSGNYDDWQGCSGTNCSFSAGTMTLAGLSHASGIQNVTYVKSPGSLNYAARFMVKNLSVYSSEDYISVFAANAVVTFQPSANGTKATLSECLGAGQDGKRCSTASSAAPVTFAGAIPQDWLILQTGRTVLVFADGKKIFDATFQNTQVSSAGGQFGFELSSFDVSLTVANVVIVDQPMLQGGFTDGAGRNLQSVAINGTQSTVNGALYDANWHRTVSSKNVVYNIENTTMNASHFAFNSGFLGRNSSGVLTGDVVIRYGSNAATNEGYTNDGGYPDADSSTKKEPESRLAKAGLPGGLYSSESPTGKFNTFNYGTNDSTNVPLQNAARQVFATQEFNTSTRTNPNAAVSNGVRTADGMGVAGMFMNASVYGGGASTNLQTLKTQDSFQRPTQVMSPRYFMPQGTEQARDNFATTISYDDNGNPSVVTNPNFGAFNQNKSMQIVNNRVGQLRFWADPDGLLNNHTNYIKYDQLGRIIEEGYLNQAFNRSQLASAAESLTSPTESQTAATWRRRYHYGVPHDIVAINSFMKGRLVAVDSRQDSTAETADKYDTQVFNFDERGRVIEVMETTQPDGLGEMTFYQYNNAGNLTGIVYPVPIGTGAFESHGATQAESPVVVDTETGIIGQSPTIISNDLPFYGLRSVSPLYAALLIAMEYSRNSYLTVGGSRSSVAKHGGKVSPHAAPTVVGAEPDFYVNVEIGVSPNSQFNSVMDIRNFVSINLPTDSTVGLSVTRPLTVSQGGQMAVNAKPGVSVKKVLYTYNGLGQVVKIGREIEGSAAVDDYYASYTYGPNGEVLSESLNNSSAQGRVATSFRYNSPGWLQSIQAVQSNNSSGFSESLDYGQTTPGRGETPTYNGLISGIDEVYSYDADHAAYIYGNFTYYGENQLKSAIYTSANGSPIVRQLGYQLESKDANSNLLRTRQAAHANDMVYSYNDRGSSISSSDRLATISESGQPNIGYTYDDNGNVTSKSGHIASMVYDPFLNRAVRVTHVDSQDNTYYQMRYGGILGERTSLEIYQNTSGSPVRKLSNTYYSGMGASPLMILQNHNPDGQTPDFTRKLMIYGPTGLIAVNDNASGTATDYFVIKDHLGSTVEVYKQDGTLQDEYYYSATGNIYKSPNGGDLVKSEQIVPFLFQGHEYDWQSELHNYRARFYDSETMTFLSPDPIFHAGQSPYVALNNNPVNYVDWNGKDFHRVNGLRTIPFYVALIIGQSLVFVPTNDIASPILSAFTFVGMSAVAVYTFKPVAAAFVQTSTVAAATIGVALAGTMWGTSFEGRDILSYDVSSLTGYVLSDLAGGFLPLVSTRGQVAPFLSGRLNAFVADMFIGIAWTHAANIAAQFDPSFFAQDAGKPVHFGGAAKYALANYQLQCDAAMVAGHLGRMAYGMAFVNVPCISNTPAWGWGYMSTWIGSRVIAKVWVNGDTPAAAFATQAGYVGFLAVVGGAGIHVPLKLPNNDPIAQSLPFWRAIPAYLCLPGPPPPDALPPVALQPAQFQQVRGTSFSIPPAVATPELSIVGDEDWDPVPADYVVPGAAGQGY